MQTTIDAVLKSEERAIARACRIIDDRAEGFRTLLGGLYPHTGRARLIGVTGAAGVGKSTLVDALVGGLRAQGERVAVLAVDPSSPFSGGAILGDRVRMQRHFEDPGVFIRSIASRGALGGLSRSAREQSFVLDAAGFSVIVVETLGVGQDELEVSEWVHSTLLVVAPGLGDDVQALKSGILEVADVFVVNKADRPGADAVVADLEQRIALGRDVAPSAGRGHGHGLAAVTSTAAADGRWEPPVVKCVATRDEGIAELLAASARHADWLKTQPGQLRTLERQRAAARRLLETLLAERIIHERAARIEEQLDELARHAVDPYTACERLLAERSETET